MRSEELTRRVDTSYEKYGWTEAQREVFDRFIEERYANYPRPENTLRSYLDLLSQLVLKVKKPFSDIAYEDLVPILREWQEEYGNATMHGRKCYRPGSHSRPVLFRGESSQYGESPDAPSWDPHTHQDS